MIKVNKKINLEQLDAELNGKGLNGVVDDTGAIVEIGLAEHNNATAQQLKTAIEAHVAIDPNVAKETAKAKLTALGLTTDDLKALGL
jgi:hypothetical protein